MKIKVDLDLCQSHGLCVEVAPEVFELRDDGFLYIVNEAPDGSDQHKLEKAALECPTGAIALQ
jgi:ferredoxin